jgi:S1-C subfamily serine protease
VGSEDTGAAVSDRPVRRRRRVVLVGAAVLVALALGLAGWWFAARPAPLTQADLDAAVARGIAQAQQAEQAAPPDAAAAYAAITPSLVTVTASGATGSRLGSGVVVTAQGAVLTALHVVDGTGAVQLAFADGTTTPAVIAARQPEHDIAVLRPARPPEIVVPAVLAPPPGVGDTVFAVGDPLGLRASLSAGVVSATGRTVEAPPGPPLAGLIQFDAAANPGNSGGPLLDRGGRVVGIVTALANPARQDFFVGIAFAVPITTAAGGAGGPQQ